MHGSLYLIRSDLEERTKTEVIVFPCGHMVRERLCRWIRTWWIKPGIEDSERPHGLLSASEEDRIDWLKG